MGQEENIRRIRLVKNKFKFRCIKRNHRRSQWPRGLRRGSAAARFLGLSVRIPPGAWMCLSLVGVVCCQVEVSVSGSSLVHGSPIEW